MVNFRTEKVTDRITRIYGICTELMYLVEGDEKAALIDTGSGFGSLKDVVSKLTDKPVIVLLTHGHTDHAMGAGEFDDVYMNHEDDYIYVPHGDKDFRWDGVKMSDEYNLVSEDDYIPTLPLEKFHDLKVGEVDLGNVTIEIYNCAGHTRGSIVMLMKEERVLLLGDACNNNTFMFEDYSLPITEYEENLKKLKSEVAGKYDMVLASHGDGRLPSDIIDGVIKVCEDIKNNNADDIPFTFRGHHGFIAKRTENNSIERIDKGSGNIVYNKWKI